MDRQVPPIRPCYQLTRGLNMFRQQKRCYDVTWSRQEGSTRRHLANAHSRDRSCRYYIQDVFFWHLAGPVALTGKAIVHWIGYSLIKI